ncbi:uncharacterized protein LOC119068165 [Bradysia coprophila]|uniref:uncharacterized protein LOC119068165 n=1 Tax=Bradysia coprophila TaxID=38358 RepID=UPI00187DBC2C|nr:uncharacterized protein LOC119068165 [Bradysia coprophila]
MDRGRLNSVYFVLSGNCTILQTLKLMYTNVHQTRKYYLADVEDLDSPARLLLEKLHCEADKKRKFSTIPAGKTEKKWLDTAKADRKTTCRNDSNESMSGTNDQLHIPNVTEEMQSEVKFVHVGTFSPGSVFGLGEEMIDRAIVARNVVQCLEIPRYLLFQKTQNLGNIWQRLKMYLNSSIPSRQQLFEDFNRTKKWTEFKEHLVYEIFKVKPSCNTTRIHDIPVLFRIDAGL